MALEEAHDNVEPFSISCTTCRARLIVRKQSALGMLVGCPKCGGMVFIQRPPTSETPSDVKQPAEMRPSEELPLDKNAKVMRRAPTPTSIPQREAAFDRVNELLAEPKASSTDEAAPDNAASACPADSLTASSQSFDDAAEVAARSASQLPLAFDEPAPDPGVDWTSIAVQKWRPWLLSAGAGLLGVACAVGVIRLIVTPKVGADSSLAGAPSLDSEADTAHALAEDVNDLDSDDVAESSPDSTTTDEGPDSRITGANTAVVDTPSDDERGPDASTTANVPDSPNVRDQFGGLADLNNEPPVAIAAVPDEGNEGDEMPIEASRPPGISVVNKARPLALDAKLRLANSIPEIRLRQIPLCQFLDLVSDLTAVPITLRWEAAMHAGVSAQKTIDVDAADATIEQILIDVLTPLHLSYELDGTQIEVKKVGSPDGKRRTTKYFVGDLAGVQRAEIDGLVELVKQVVAPRSWRGNGGDGQVVVKDDRLYMKQSESAHFEAILLLEKLRVARGLSPLSSYPRELFDLQGRRETARELLTRPVRIRSQTSVRLADFCRALGAEAECDILPDWRALAVEGWLPHSEVTCQSDEVPFHEVLEQFAENLHLSFRVLDRRTFEITTKSAELRQPEFSFYDVSELIDQGLESAEIIARLRQAMGADQLVEGGGTGVVAYDPTSKHLIARLPQSQQILVADFLSTWGA